MCGWFGYSWFGMKIAIPEIKVKEKSPGSGGHKAKNLRINESSLAFYVNIKVRSGSSWMLHGARLQTPFYPVPGGAKLRSPCRRARMRENKARESLSPVLPCMEESVEWISLRLPGRTMKQHNELSILAAIIGLFLASSAASHPYDSPLTFRKHKSDSGGIVWSNIPKACFSKGLLRCEKLHPIYGNPVRPGETRTNTQKPKTGNATKATHTVD